MGRFPCQPSRCRQTPAAVPSGSERHMRKRGLPPKCVAHFLGGNGLLGCFAKPRPFMGGEMDGYVVGRRRALIRIYIAHLRVPDGQRYGPVVRPFSEPLSRLGYLTKRFIRRVVARLGFHVRRLLANGRGSGRKILKCRLCGIFYKTVVSCWNCAGFKLIVRSKEGGSRIKKFSCVLKTIK